MAKYAIIAIGGSQYRVSEGERLLVDRIAHDEKKTFHPSILFVGGDGTAELSPKNAQVTARVVEHVLGPKGPRGTRPKRAPEKNRAAPGGEPPRAPATPRAKAARPSKTSKETT